MRVAGRPVAEIGERDVCSSERAREIKQGAAAIGAAARRGVFEIAIVDGCAGSELEPDRVDDRRVLNGILWRLRTGRSWAAIPEQYGPPTTCQARFVRWRDAGVWSRIVHAVAEVHSGELELIQAEPAKVRPSYERKPMASNDIVAWKGRSEG